MFWAITLGYCITCWLVGLVVARIWAPQFAARAANNGISAFQLELRAVLMAPLAMPLIVWMVGKALIQQLHRRSVLRWALKTVREYEFSKVNILYLASPVRRQLEQHTP